MQTELTAFMQPLESRGAPAAMDVYRQSAQRPQIAKAVENVINSYGYRVLGENRAKEAIAIFRLNTEAFPAEYNTCDMELRPGDENATRMLRQMGVTVNGP